MTTPTIEDFDREVSDRADALIDVSVREAKSWSAFISDVIERHEHLPEHLLTASLIAHLKRIEKATDDIEKELT